MQNARLHAFVRAGKQEWEATFDAIGDPIAVFDRHGRLLRGNAALAALPGPAGHRAARTVVRRGRSLRRRVPGLRGRPRRRARSCVHDEVTRPGDRIFSVTTCPVVDATDGAAIVQIAKNVTLEIQNARRHAPDERRARRDQRPAARDRRAAQGDPGAAAAGREALGDRPARRRRGARAEQSADQRDRLRAAAAGRGPRTRARATRRARRRSLVHDLRRIAEESERAAKIVRNLLAFARRQSAARAEQDVADVMTRVIVAPRLRVPPERDRAGDRVRARAAAGARRRRPAAAGAAEPAAQRRAGDARRDRCAASASARGRVPDADAVELFIADTRPRHSRTRTCGGSSIRSSPRAKSAKAPASASASATASSAITAGRSPSRAASARGRRSRCCCRRAAQRRAAAGAGRASRSDRARLRRGRAHRVGPHGDRRPKSTEDARARLAAGGIDVALVDDALIAADRRGVARGAAGAHGRPGRAHSHVGSGGNRGGRPSIRTGGAARRAARSLRRSAYERAEAAAGGHRRRAGHSRRGQPLRAAGRLRGDHVSRAGATPSRSCRRGGPIW